MNSYYPKATSTKKEVSPEQREKSRERWQNRTTEQREQIRQRQNEKYEARQLKKGKVVKPRGSYTLKGHATAAGVTGDLEVEEEDGTRKKLKVTNGDLKISSLTQTAQITRKRVGNLVLEGPQELLEQVLDPAHFKAWMDYRSSPNEAKKTELLRLRSAHYQSAEVITDSRHLLPESGVVSAEVLAGDFYGLRRTVNIVGRKEDEKGLFYECRSPGVQGIQKIYPDELENTTWPFVSDTVPEWWMRAGSCYTFPEGHLIRVLSQYYSSQREMRFKKPMLTYEAGYMRKNDGTIPVFHKRFEEMVWEGYGEPVEVTNAKYMEKMALIDAKFATRVLMPDVLPSEELQIIHDEIGIIREQRMMIARQALDLVHLNYTLKIYTRKVLAAEKIQKAFRTWKLMHDAKEDITGDPPQVGPHQMFVMRLRYAKYSNAGPPEIVHERRIVRVVDGDCLGLTLAFQNTSGGGSYQFFRYCQMSFVTPLKTGFMPRTFIIELRGIAAANRIRSFYKNWKATRRSYTKMLKMNAEKSKKLREAKREAEYLCGNWGRRCGDPVSTQAHNDMNRLRELIQSAIDAIPDAA